MFKIKKIREFVKKHADEFSEYGYGELVEFLSNIEDITGLISKINKLSKEDEEYVLSTIINYEEFEFSHNDVHLILNHKLDIIKKYEEGNRPNLDSIYYALQPNTNLYKALVGEYIKLGSDDSEQILINYSSALSKYPKEFNGMLNKLYSTVSLKKQLLFFKPKHFEIFLAFGNEYTTKQNKRRMLEYLFDNDSMKEDIESLNSDDFHYLLSFIFSKPNDMKNLKKYDYIGSRLELLPEIVKHIDQSKEYKLDREFINNLRIVPLSFLDTLSDKECQTNSENYKFVEIIDKYKDPEIVDIAIKRLESFQSKEHAKVFVEFITDDFFINNSVDRQKKLLMLFPDETVDLDIDEDLELIIPDVNAVKEVFLPDEKLEFINQKTNMKIIIKNKSKKN
mgnify:CR=1 FL=1